MMVWSRLADANNFTLKLTRIWTFVFCPPLNLSRHICSCKLIRCPGAYVFGVENMSKEGLTEKKRRRMSSVPYSFKDKSTTNLPPSPR